MDTRFYTLNSRCTKVSGGADLISFVAAPSESSEPAAPSASAGELLDFERCRLRLERKALLATSAAPQSEEPERMAEVSELVRLTARTPQASEKRGNRWALLADLIASAAILGVSIAAALSFLRLA